MKRAEFLKKLGLGIFTGAAIVETVKNPLPVFADTAVSDNLGEGSVRISSTEPVDKASFWVDTSVNNVFKYFNGREWVPVHGRSVGGPRQAIYLNDRGEFIPVEAVTDSFNSNGTAPVSGRAVASAVSNALGTSKGSMTQGIYIDEHGQIQACAATTNNYNKTGTAPVSGKAIHNALTAGLDQGFMIPVNPVNTAAINLYITTN